MKTHLGTPINVTLSTAPITVAGQLGSITIARDIGERLESEQRLGKSHSRLRTELRALQENAQRDADTIQELRTTLMMLNRPDDNSAPCNLLQQVREATSPKTVCELSRKLPIVAKALAEGGNKASNINRFITAGTDEVLRALIPMAISELGKPPAPFAFMIMGSEGRREQTLKTDQDNAIIFADPQGGNRRDVRNYFVKLGERVCTQLADGGYAFCEGNIMAQNPTWVRSLSEWAGCFRTWIWTLEPQDLLQTKIFFDFRCAYGDSELIHALRHALREDLQRNQRFFGLFAWDVQRYSPPIGLFGNIQLEKAGDDRKVLDIKSAMVPIVDLARVYALRHELDATNTVQRLRGLEDLGALPTDNVEEIVQAYNALMQMRIDNQIRALRDAKPVDNLVDPSDLTVIERRILKESFTQIKAFQTRLAYDFTGLPTGV